MNNLTRKEEIDIYETIKKSFPKTLVKDLTKNERICPICNGLGMEIEDNIYGIMGDNSEAGRKYHFPYKHQALSFCKHCFNGVQRLCPYCGKPYENQSYLHCDCEGQVEADKKKKLKMWNEMRKETNKQKSKAVPVDEKDVTTMLYCEELDKYYCTTEEFLNDYLGNYNEENVDDRPEVLWVTSEEQIKIDAYDIVENACESLHEDAMDNILSEDITRLQNFLDKWCEEQTGTTTYYPCYEEYIEIDWPDKEKYNKNNDIYKQLFLDRWKELNNQINLERDEDGEIISTSFLKEDVFHKFFSSPELLVGYYLWRGNGSVKDGGDAEYYFELEYDNWADDCKEIVQKAKNIFETQITKETIV